MGTSAGSVVGAQVCSGVPVEELYAAQLRPADGEVAARFGVGAVARLLWAGGRTRDAAAGRGPGSARWRRAARTPSEASRRAVIEGRLPSPRWPARRLLVTAVDAVTGEFVVFDAASGVSLVDAVGASCAVPGVWPPVTIGDRRYVDGGVRSAVNADLAAGAEAVVVLAPVSSAFGPMPRLSAQVAALRRRGAGDGGGAGRGGAPGDRAKRVGSGAAGGCGAGRVGRRRRRWPTRWRRCGADRLGSARRGRSAEVCGGCGCR